MLAIWQPSIEEAAARKQARIDSGKDHIIGVNVFRLYEETPIDILEKYFRGTFMATIPAIDVKFCLLPRVFGFEPLRMGKSKETKNSSFQLSNPSTMIEEYK